MTTTLTPTHQPARVELWLATQQPVLCSQNPYAEETAMDKQATAIVGVADTRSTTLDRLAGEGAQTAADSLRHVLPADGAGRVAVAAFGSSI